MEQVAYSAMHGEDDTPWRCTVCDALSRHSTAEIVPHLTEVHGFAVTSLREERGGQIFLYSDAKAGVVPLTKDVPRRLT